MRFMNKKNYVNKIIMTTNKRKRKWKNTTPIALSCEKKNKNQLTKLYPKSFDRTKVCKTTFFQVTLLLPLIRNFWHCPSRSFYSMHTFDFPIFFIAQFYLSKSKIQTNVFANSIIFFFHSFTKNIHIYESLELFKQLWIPIFLP